MKILNRHFIPLLLLGTVTLAAYGQDEMAMEKPVLGHDWTGRQIMDEVYKRHQQYPYIYEDQSMVLVDARGQKDTRRLHRYSRMEEDGTIKFLLIFLTPAEVKGVSLLAVRNPDGNTVKHVYLPALGKLMVESIATESEDNFLGSDFSVENLTGEILDDYSYERAHDTKLDGNYYFVVDAYKGSVAPEQGIPIRRHYIRQDNFFITRSDHFDQQGRVFKQQSNHDLKQLDGVMWRASMILMQDLRENHSSLIKIHHRIFSQDYVPAEMFTAEWLFENHPADDADPESMSEDQVLDENNVSSISSEVAE